mmetsp:Transcript_10787/g.16091  ORF Transcript_10787/g.16091 Transcript_10787/m.16091 type:complete len:128 (-) Transcript_10787:1108-1491(-)
MIRKYISKYKSIRFSTLAVNEASYLQPDFVIAASNCTHLIKEMAKNDNTSENFNLRFKSESDFDSKIKQFSKDMIHPLSIRDIYSFSEKKIGNRTSQVSLERVAHSIHSLLHRTSKSPVRFERECGC